MQKNCLRQLILSASANTSGRALSNSAAKKNQVLIRNSSTFSSKSGKFTVVNNHQAIREQSTTKVSLSHAQTGLKREDETQPEVEELKQNSIVQQPPDAHKFVKRHIGPSEEDIGAMLDELNYKSLNDLIEDTIPSQIRLRRSMELPESLSEDELINELKQFASMNEGSLNWKNYIGLGYYNCITPAVILRNIFENPGWTTAYTAYQAEIAQGRLESLMNYQTMICDLTGLDVANASLLDESTAAAEALQVCLRHSKSKRNKFLISTNCYPQTKAVVETRAKALGIEIDYFDELKLFNNNDQDASDNLNYKLNEKFNLKDYCGVLIQYPNSDGYLYDINAITRVCKENDVLVVSGCDLMACTLFKPPGEFNYAPDLAIGSSQRFGVPLNYGGPHAGFLACKQSLVRLIPGRVVGLTRDSNGKQAYRFALQTREQHIRRDRATSNICTAQALLANMSAMYAVYHGPKGLKEIASSIHMKTSLLAHLISNGNSNSCCSKLLNDNQYFDTLNLQLDSLDSYEAIKQKALEAKVNLRFIDDQRRVCISLDETTKLKDIFQLASLFSDSPLSSNGTDKAVWLAPLESEQMKHLIRQTKYLQHPTFNTYKSEAQLVRYMKSLENKDISLAHSMIPLGSCTMKLNATSQMLASSWPEFANCHPFQPTKQLAGYMKLFQELDRYLCEITGYDRISFQPNSGAQGEYAGLRVIKSYLESLGQQQQQQQERNICLIPISAHGTNPASAQMAGFKIQTIKVNEKGNIDFDDLKRNVEKFKDQLACLMITYPSTFGVFESNVREVCDLIHSNGGQVYLDGANMNAQVGLCRPGDYGSDVSHLNLHKTFCIPHGGGGPGAGPIGVKKHLIPFLPSHPLISEAEQTSGSHVAQGAAEERPKEESFGTISSSMWGSPAILPISWSYIRLMSKDLRFSSEVAILNANYMRKRLEKEYKILYTGEKGNVAHEFILDCRPFKKSANIEAVDIAKRLQDFGLHAPTVSWPVTNTLMLEPTESEDKYQLDKYCEALMIIRKEIQDIEEGKLDKLMNPIKMAPHTQEIVCSSQWNRPYTREQAAFPAKFVNPISKIWPTVGRVDDTYGDTNLFCTCPPVSETEQ